MSLKNLYPSSATFIHFHERFESLTKGGMLNADSRLVRIRISSSDKHGYRDAEKNKGHPHESTITSTLPGTTRVLETTIDSSWPSYTKIL
ncbi:hypothetical protein OO006_11915 [Prosthecochloris sp. SCSIO W1101]|uniref:hypothetical protein n=1 Tax=Prosthecochloris sp. SCSIO W1101 TaxID=2992242 RepID=UPI00223DBFF5|nr:hypothetical protein [Prosthecochloris sp. SCSIO W1101]UZJ41045.1 hypothetical protein OO006_11915 [Prosthecochloris sp. SCSIO W1101]